MNSDLHAGHGYRVLVQAARATAALTTTRAKHHAKTGSESSYIARRGPGDGAIRATFGDLGSIAMRFRPGGAVTYSKPQEGCVGADRYTIHHGVFVGSLRFRGEDGYVSAKAHRVAGVSIAPLSLDCGGSRASGRASERRCGSAADLPFRSGLPLRAPRRVLRREPRKALIRPGLSPLSNRPSAGSRSTAWRSPEAGPAASPPMTRSSFATIAPTAPFAGTGSMTRDPTGARLWGGSLTVSFPGAPDVPLTGPLFKTRLSRSL